MPAALPVVWNRAGSVRTVDSFAMRSSSSVTGFSTMLFTSLRISSIDAPVTSARTLVPIRNGPCPRFSESAENAPYVYPCASRRFMLIRLEKRPPKIVFARSNLSKSGSERRTESALM